MGSIFKNAPGKLSAETKVSSDKYPFDPSLLPAITDILPRFDSVEQQSAYIDYLIRKIVRNPRDLKSHLQRIFLHHSLGDNESYFGALIDLFIALGPNGLALKKSVLRPTYRLLDRKQRNFIRDHLRTGLTATQIIPGRESRLSKGLSSTNRIVIDPSGNDADSRYNPLSTARQKLSQGDVETARIVLEKALESDPGDLEIGYELLELYRQKNLKKAFMTMSTRLVGKTLASQEKWTETEHYFANLPS